MSKVTDLIIKGMHEQGCYSVGWLDGWVLDQICDEVKVKNPHPLNRMRAVFAHLEHDDRFVKNLRRSMNSRGHEVLVRVFRLKEEYRT